MPCRPVFCSLTKLQQATLHGAAEDCSLGRKDDFNCCCLLTKTGPIDIKRTLQATHTQMNEDTHKHTYTRTDTHFLQKAFASLLNVARLALQLSKAETFSGQKKYDHTRPKGDQWKPLGVVKTTSQCCAAVNDRLSQAHQRLPQDKHQIE